MKWSLYKVREMRAEESETLIGDTIITVDCPLMITYERTLGNLRAYISAPGEIMIRSESGHMFGYLHWEHKRYGCKSVLATNDYKVKAIFYET